MAPREMRQCQANSKLKAQCSFLGRSHIGQRTSGEYFAQLASGGTLLLETIQFSTSEVFLPANQSGQLAASINKPVSRLNSVFCSFVPPLDAANKAAGKQVVNTFQWYGKFA